MLIPTIPAHRGASSGDGPEGGAGSGSPPPWFVTTAAGAAGSPGRRLRAFDGKRPGARNAAVERREAKRPDRKGRWTPRERPGVRKRTHTGASQAPSAISALRSPSLGRERHAKDTSLATPQNKRAGGAFTWIPT